MPGSEGNSRWTAWLAAVVVAAPLAALFWPVLLTDQSLAIRDAGHFYHPLLKWTSDQWLRGGPPLWNPYENAGMPLLADGTSALFYPPRLVLLLPLDFARLYNSYVVGHVALAALGSYLLARQFRASVTAAATAAICYSCGGSVVFQHSNVVYLVGAAWLPFAAWGIDVMLVRRSWRAAVGLGVVLAMMILGGDPQMAYHTLLMAGLYTLRQPEAQAKELHPLAGLKFPSLARQAGGRVCLIALAAAVAFLLAAVQILPSVEAARNSDRAYYDEPRTIYEAAALLATDAPDQPQDRRRIAGGILGQPGAATHHDRLYDFSVGPWRLIELVWPNIGGRMFPNHRRWMTLIPAEGRIWTPTLYLGLVPVLLAVSQFRLRRGEPRQVWLSWLMLLASLASFGGFGLGWMIRETYGSVLGGDPSDGPIGSPVGGLYWGMVTGLPGYVGFRYPAKLMIVAAFAVSQLAALGWDRVLLEPAPRLTRFAWRLSIASVALLVASSLAFVWLNRAIEQQTPLGHRVSQWLSRQSDSSLGPFDLGGAQRDVAMALLQTAAVALAALWLWRKARADSRQRWRWCLVALVALDVTLANGWLVPTAPSEVWRTSPPVARVIAGEHPPRVYRAGRGTWQPSSFRSTSDDDRIAQIAAWERGTLYPKYGLTSDISLVESSSSLKNVDVESFWRVARQHGPAGSESIAMPHPVALRLMAVDYLIAPDRSPKPPFAEPVALSANVELPQGAALWRLEDPLPRAWIVHQVEQLPELKGRSLAAVEERTRDVLFPRSGSNARRQARDFRASAVVESDLPVELPRARGAPSEAESCRIIRYELDRVEVAATLASPGLVVLSDTFAPGWTASVQTGAATRPAAILRTDRICRGILLPAGEHRIAMTYSPANFRQGAWISGAAWALLVAAVIATLVPQGPRQQIGHRGKDQ